MKKTNRKEMYDALAKHYQAFPTFAGDDAARIDDIMLKKGAADIKMDLMDAELKLVHDSEQATIDSNRQQELKALWQKDLDAEQKEGGHNRAHVIEDLQNKIASVPAV